MVRIVIAIDVGSKATFLRPKKWSHENHFQIPDLQETYSALIQIELALVHVLALVRADQAIVQTGSSLDQTSTSSS
jgi:hypothetical protein